MISGLLFRLFFTENQSWRGNDATWGAFPGKRREATRSDLCDEASRAIIQCLHVFTAV
jgi:hypothetical protein